MYNTVAVSMGVSSLINLGQTQEENQRRHGNNGAGLLSDMLVHASGTFIPESQGQFWEGRTWSGHRDSPQPLRTCLFAHPALWSHVPAGVGGRAGAARTQKAGWSLSPAPRGSPRRAGCVHATHSWYSGIAASPSPPWACLTRKAFHSDSNIHRSRSLDV